MKNLVRAAAFIAFSTAGLATADPVAVTGAWVRATPPGARTAAAYLTLTSGGPADRLLGGTTPAARELQLHTHVNEAGTQRMVQLAELAVPAGGTVRLEPGGLHLMLLDITEPLRPGTAVALSLHFAAAGTVDITVPVVDARTTPAAPHNHP